MKVLAFLAVGLMALAAVKADDFTARICTISPAEQAFCQDVVTNILNPKHAGWSCVERPSDKDCILAIQNNQADLRTMDAGDMYEGWKFHNLKVIVGEDYGEGLLEYYAVAIVNKDFCIGSPTYADLRGKKSCHTGYRKTVGWNMPVGFMIREGIMPVVSKDPKVNNDAESVASFFTKTCAARPAANGPLNTADGKGSVWSGLCSLCAGDCSDSEKYYDYSGAFQCLVEGAGDVAFAKHTTALEYAKDGSKPVPGWPVNKNIDDLMLLCPGGGCKSPRDWLTCNSARVPSHGVMVRSNYQYAAGVTAALVEAGSDPAFQAKVFNTATNSKSYLFKASTKALRPVLTDTASFMGTTLAAVEGLYASDAPGKICTISPEEQAFCNDIVNNLNGKNYAMKFECVQRTSDKECIIAIEEGLADMRTMDAGDMYDGHQNHNLQAAVAEDYGEGDLEYYAVAIVNKAFCDGRRPTYADLKGKKSCHTGYRKTVGWNVPTGLMINKGIMPIVAQDPKVNNDAESVAAFFDKSCAARAASNGPMPTPDGKGKVWSETCDLCKGDCSDSDPYYDYSGALRCLTEGAGDVAFAKHTTVSDFAKDGKSPQPWSTKNIGDYMLLCPDGGCMSPLQYEQCSAARVPSHSVMVRNGYLQKGPLQDALQAISNDAYFKSKVFNGTSNPKSYLFKSSTKALRPIFKDTVSFMGATYNSMAGLYAATAAKEQEAPTVVVETKGVGLSAGAAAGLAVGLVLAGILLAVLGTVIYLRSKRNKTPFAKYGDTNGANGA